MARPITWNWQRPAWPRLTYDARPLAARETAFQRGGGIVVGSARHIGADERDELIVELIASEALKTSEIEGEILDRASVQSSVRRQFGLATDARRVKPAERGIAEVMVDLYRTFAAPLDAATLFRWHASLMQGRRDVGAIGQWRRHAEPMQVVSGSLHEPKIHFEAPPSARMAAEMAAFITWFERTRPDGEAPMPALARAGIAHLYFVSIHPFEDGNGRIARALAEKCLAQGLGTPSLTALSQVIEERRKAYYDALEAANKDVEVTEWLIWFADTVIAAQDHTRAWIGFLIAKAQLLSRLAGTLNERQEKALLRMLREGPRGFEGGLSAGNYVRITGATAATARRDLVDLVGRGVLRRTGEKKATRYWLVLAGVGDRG